MDKTPQNRWPLKAPQKTALPALLLLLFNLGITLTFCLQFKQHLEAQAVKEFMLNSQHIALRIQERLWNYSEVLRGGAALFAASEQVTREEWRAYIERLAHQNDLSGAQGIGFAKLVSTEQLDAHISAIRSEGFPAYSVFPPGQRAVYAPIIYLEPFRDRNLRAFGYDMYAEPVRRQAMLQARDTGLSALSGKVELVQETGQQVQPGVLIYTPVYQNGLPTNTVAQRQQALIGWVYSPYRMQDMMSNILREWQQQLHREIELNIYDGTAIKAESLLFSNTGNPALHRDSIFLHQQQISLNNNHWLLVFDRQDRLSSFTYLPVWLSLLSGVLISGLIYLLTLNWFNTKARAERMAEQLSNEVIEKQHLLTESEMRSKLALEGSSLGLWDWNIASGTVYFSPLWKTMLGYQEDDIGNQLSEWESRIHPDDLAATEAAVEAYLAGQSASYSNEHRVRCKDGSYKWILDRGTVVAHNADGKPLRMLGTHSDITDRKMMEQSLRATQANLLEAQRIAQVGSWSMDLTSGKVSWTSEIFRLFGLDPSGTPPTLEEQEKLYTPTGWQQLSQAIEHTLASGTPYELDLEVLNPDGSRQWMFVRGETVLDDKDNIIGLQGTVANITAKKRDMLRIEQLGRLYNALSACNNAIVHCTSEEDLFAAICRIVVELGNMKMAWIGLIDEQSGKILPVNCYGNGTEYLEGIHISIDADLPEGRGATGTATRDNKPYWIDDFNNNPVTQPWRERAARYGWVSSAALPICRHQQPIGALTFYSAESGWFSKEIRALLEEIAADISFALDKLASERAAEERLARLSEAEQRFKCVVEQSITGAYIIQNNKMVYANPRLAEMLGYSNNDELVGISVFDLIAAKDHARVKLEAERLRNGEIKQTETAFALKRKDGQLINVGSSSSIGSYRQQPALIGIIQDTSSTKVAERHIRRYVQQLENIFIQTVGLATTLSEMRDPYTAGHEQRVAEIAVAIGKEMGLDENTLEGLRVGCYLHDVGKMRVPIDILSKPGKLTASEYALIKEHAQAGYDVLKDVEFPWPVAQIALQHHERMDGSGYPQGLKGNQILLEARITAVADVIESMAAHRPYRASVGLDQALAEIERGSGSSYDSEVANACLRLFRDKGYTLSQ